MSPFLQPVKVLLDGHVTLWSVSHPSQFCVIRKLIEVSLHLITQPINEDVTQDWIQYLPLGYTISYWPSPRLLASDHQPLSPSSEPAFNPFKRWNGSALHVPLFGKHKIRMAWELRFTIVLWMF